jgi:hypothetical protein
MTELTLYLYTDHILELVGLADGESGASIADATVQATLLDSDGTQIAGATWPQTLTAVPGTPGTYRGSLPHTLELVCNRTVQVEIVADAGPGLYRTWYQSLRVQSGAV